MKIRRIEIYPVSEDAGLTVFRVNAKVGDFYLMACGDIAVPETASPNEAATLLGVKLGAVLRLAGGDGAQAEHDRALERAERRRAEQARKAGGEPEGKEPR